METDDPRLQDALDNVRPNRKKSGAASSEGATATEPKPPRPKLGVLPELPSRDLLNQEWTKHFASKYTDAEATRLFPVELPSGMIVVAKRISIVLLMRVGRIPDSLSPLVSWMIEQIESGGTQNLVKKLEERQADPSQVDQLNMTFGELFNFVWMYSVVSPTFTEKLNEVKDDVFYVGDVDQADKEFLYQWAQGVDDDVRTFLQKQQAAVMGAVPAVD